MIAILGGLGAAAAWALSTLCSSRSSRMLHPNSVVAWVMLVGLVITLPVALSEGVPAKLDTSAGWWLLLSGAGNVAGLMCGYRALRAGKVALVAPLISTEGAIAALIALLAGESISPGAGVTLAMIAAGVSLSSVPPGSAEPERATHATAVVFAVLSACMFGVSLYATGRAGAELPTAWVVLAARVIGVLALLVPLAVTGRLQISRRALPLVVTSGVCEVLGFFSFTAGSRHGIAISAVLSSQFAAISVVLAYLLFSERLSRVQLVGVATVIAGVALLSALRA
jgi:drug/metabolite transporter (DMT)-like permease